MPAQTNPRRHSPLQSSLSTNNTAFESLFDRLTLEEDAANSTTTEMPRLVAPPKSFADETEKENAPSTPRPVRKSRMSMQSTRDMFSDESDEAVSEGEDEDFHPLENQRLRAKTPSIAKGYLTPRRPSMNSGRETSPSKSKRTSISVRSTPRNSNASEIIRGTATPGLHKSGRRLPSLFDDDMEGTPSSRSRHSLFDMSMTPSRRRNKEDEEDAADKLNFLSGFKGIGGGSTRQLSLKQSLAELRKGEECKKANRGKLPLEAAFDDVTVVSMPDVQPEPEQDVTTDETELTPKAPRARSFEVDMQLVQEAYAQETKEATPIPTENGSPTTSESEDEPVQIKAERNDEPVKVKAERNDEPVRVKAERQDERFSPSPTPASSGTRGYSREVSIGVVIPVKGKSTAEQVLIKKEESASESEEDDDDTFTSVQESLPSISAASSVRSESVDLISDYEEESEESEEESEEDEPVRARRRPAVSKTTKPPSEKSISPPPSKKSISPPPSEPSRSRTVTPMVVIPVPPRTKEAPAVAKVAAAPSSTPNRTPAGLRSFKKLRAKLAADILAELREGLKSECEKIGPMKETNLEWSATLRKTAGLAKFKSLQPARIVLSEKVVDDEDRLWTTLSHEFCHVLAFHYHDEIGHGANFKRWASAINKVFPRVKITTCHNYEIEYKYRWNCTKEDCTATYGRHGQTIDPTTQVCGRCKSKLVQVLPAPGKEKKLTGYQIFVKEKLPKAKIEVKKAGLPAGKAMSLVAEWWKEEKARVASGGASKEASPTPSISLERELSVVADMGRSDVEEGDDVIVLSD